MKLATLFFEADLGHQFMLARYEKNITLVAAAQACSCTAEFLDRFEQGKERGPYHLYRKLLDLYNKIIYVTLEEVLVYE